MTRRAFRAELDAPRPTAAWVMATVAASTLWLTRQLEPLALLAQAAALAISFTYRRQPCAWQRNPWVLNLGMFVVSGVTIATTLRGASSTVALAHFAVLAQGLQLLDARPRRSEFLLVALALFQVLLAANLTDSIFFVPLLGAFVVSTTWTLIVHTLRAEALEAGVAHALPGVLTAGLLRTAFLASGASFLLGFLLFVMLPRLQGSVVQGGGPGAPAAGFSDRVELGELGRIRRDATVALRVETLEGEPPPPEAAYWRGLAFDRFDGRGWSVTPARRWNVPGTAEVGLTLEPGAGQANLVQRIVREPVASGVIFAPGEPRALQGTLRRLERDANAGFYAPTQGHERVRYTVRSHAPSWSDAELARDEARPPHADGVRFLQLPPFPATVAQLAARLVAGKGSDAERARAIEAWLRRTGRYTDDPPARSAARSPVEAFLFEEMAGHCEYFATAMVVLARSVGLPARLVNGFAGGRENAIGGFVELTRSDAHAWVEIHFADAGWVRYDPTPPDRRLRAAVPAPLLERIRQLGSAVELWWFQRVVGFDRSDQLHAMKSAWLAWRRVQRPDVATPGDMLEPGENLRSAGAQLPRLVAGLTGALALAAGLVWWTRRRHPAARPAAYGEALRILARRGLVRAPSATASAFARRVRPELPDAAAHAFDALTAAHLAVRFGGHRAPASGELLAQLRRGLRGIRASRAGKSNV